MPTDCHATRNVSRFLLVLLLGAGMLPMSVMAQEDAAPAAETKSDETTDEATQPMAPKPLDPKLAANGLHKLMENEPVWIDTKRKMVIMDGEICLRKGSLEMFACLRGTKEHESIVAIPVQAHVVHAGLLAIGAKEGEPVSWDPEYTPPTGEVIDVLVQWTDENDKLNTVRAQEWVREAQGKKVMSYNWVFPGSYFWKDIPLVEIQKAEKAGIDPNTLPGKMVYAAEGGELICVSNFRSSMLDLPVPSTDANNNLWFEANTDEIPPEGTKVRVFLIPNKGKTAKLEAAQAATKKAKPAEEKTTPTEAKPDEADADN